MLFRKTPKEKLLQQFHLQVKTELEALIDVLNWFEEVARSLLPDKSRWQCKLALAEAFTNTVRYAHQNLPSTLPIDLEIQLFPDYLEVRIYDWGHPFDIHAKLQSLQEQVGDYLERESDRGLIFMEELTDDLQYLRLADERNCLIMRKNLPCTPSQSTS